MDVDAGRFCGAVEVAAGWFCGAVNVDAGWFCGAMNVDAGWFCGAVNVAAELLPPPSPPLGVLHSGYLWPFDSVVGAGV